MLLDRMNLLGGEFAAASLPAPGECPERSIGLVTPCPAGNLGHFGGRQPPLSPAVEFGEPGESNMAEVEVEAHSDGIGGNDEVDFA